jgi:heat-inducible transcriptional repressor
LVLAVHESGGRIATSSWKPEPTIDSMTLRRTIARVQAVLPLRDSGAATLHATRERRLAPADGASLAADVFERIAGLLGQAGSAAVRIDGADNIASQPEFQSPARLRPLVSLLAEREPLARALEAIAETGRARVSIGRENGTGAMKGCSIVGLRVESGGMQGLLGIMGPVRMPYRRLVSLVSYVGERLAEGS